MIGCELGMALAHRNGLRRLNEAFCPIRIILKTHVPSPLATPAALKDTTGVPHRWPLLGDHCSDYR